MRASSFIQFTVNNFPKFDCFFFSLLFFGLIEFYRNKIAFKLWIVWISIDFKGFLELVLITNKVNLYLSFYFFFLCLSSFLSIAVKHIEVSHVCRIDFCHQLQLTLAIWYENIFNIFICWALVQSSNVYTWIICLSIAYCSVSIYVDCKIITTRNAKVRPFFVGTNEKKKTKNATNRNAK